MAVPGWILSLGALLRLKVPWAVHTLSDLVSNTWEYLFQNRTVLYNISKLTSKDSLWHNGIDKFLFKHKETYGDVHLHFAALSRHEFVLRILFNYGTWMYVKKGLFSGQRFLLNFWIFITNMYACMYNIHCICRFHRILN